jgi:hypothetical protein
MPANSPHSGDITTTGAVLHTGDQILPFGKNLWALPIEALWST